MTDSFWRAKEEASLKYPFGSIESAQGCLLLVSQAILESRESMDLHIEPESSSLPAR